MIKFLDRSGFYLLPTGWHEVSTAQYCDLDRLACATVEQRASYFAGRPIQVNGLVADTLAYLLHEPAADGGLSYPLDLGQETYLQVELLRATLAQQPIYACFGDVYAIFVARRRGFQRKEFRQGDVASISGQALPSPSLDTHPAVRHCLLELQRLAAKYARLAEPCTCEGCSQAQQAGIRRFDGFSYLNVLKAVAAHFHTDMDTVAQWPAETVYLHLLHERMHHEYQVDLHHVQKNNHG